MAGGGEGLTSLRICRERSNMVTMPYASLMATSGDPCFQLSPSSSLKQERAFMKLSLVVHSQCNNLFAVAHENSTWCLRRSRGPLVFMGILSFILDWREGAFDYITTSISTFNARNSRQNPFTNLWLMISIPYFPLIWLICCQSGPWRLIARTQSTRPCREGHRLYYNYII